MPQINILTIRRLAGNTAGSGLGPWHLAKSKALSVEPIAKLLGRKGKADSQRDRT
jgi:hypothetical protein